MGFGGTSGGTEEGYVMAKHSATDMGGVTTLLVFNSFLISGFLEDGECTG